MLAFSHGQGYSPREGIPLKGYLHINPSERPELSILLYRSNIKSMMKMFAAAHFSGAPLAQPEFSGLLTRTDFIVYCQTAPW